MHPADDELLEHRERSQQQRGRAGRSARSGAAASWPPSREPRPALSPSSTNFPRISALPSASPNGRSATPCFAQHARLVEQQRPRTRRRGRATQIAYERSSSRRRSGTRLVIPGAARAGPSAPNGGCLGAARPRRERAAGKARSPSARAGCGAPPRRCAGVACIPECGPCAPPAPTRRRRCARSAYVDHAVVAVLERPVAVAPEMIECAVDGRARPGSPASALMKRLPGDMLSMLVDGARPGQPRAASRSTVEQVGADRDHVARQRAPGAGRAGCTSCGPAR